MAKTKKFPHLSIRKIVGGRDPLNAIEEFIKTKGFIPEECEQDIGPDNRRWMVKLDGTQELEILLEGIRQQSNTTIYLGINIALVSIRNAQEMLTAALELADGLIGIKLSLVGHFLVLSSSFSANEASVENLENAWALLSAQQRWFTETLAKELKIDTLTLE